ncbi:MAG: putative thiol:disulfide interchange protein DsbC precursor [Smithella sp. PtaU1.Bin162]|nr:MAG: putative thiol:disulfide interchange protein DsbC precursor [Smithella sp. PtaU1.Bin162]
MKRITVFLLFLLLTMPVWATAKDLSPEEMFKANFPGRSFESITPAVIPGVYEVYTGNQLYYYAPEANILIYGNMVSKEGINLTRESYLKKIAPKMAQLPLDSALKIGEGKNVIVEFIDPDCFHCRESYKYFSRRKDVTMYIFFYPLSSLSEKKILHILCGPDQLKVYNEMMGGYLDNKAKWDACTDKKAEETMKTHKKLAARIGIRSTPFFYLKGQAVDGFELPILEQLLKK